MARHEGKIGKRRRRTLARRVIAVIRQTMSRYASRAVTSFTSRLFGPAYLNSSAPHPTFCFQLSSSSSTSTRFYRPLLSPPCAPHFDTLLLELSPVVIKSNPIYPFC